MSPPLSVAPRPARPFSPQSHSQRQTSSRTLAVRHRGSPRHQGDAFKTWTHKNGYFWLKDHLPNALPGARVYSFGYDARVLFSRGVGDLDSFARGLLNGLMDERRSEEERRRRIVFICHSMGGIVVKRALYLAREDPEHDNIRTSLSAILFLATPHRGSKEADVPWVVGKLIKKGISLTPRLLRLGTLRLDLIEALKANSQILTGISSNFNDQGLMIASFIEQDVSWPSMKRIVDDDSGVLGLPNERKIPMPACDHRTICRFWGEESQRLKDVMGLIMDFADAANAMLNAEANALDIACLQSLTFSSITTRHHSLSPPHPTTCTWLLTHPSYTSFLSTTPSILWLKGKPGTGKTTLLSHLHSTFLSLPPSSPTQPLVLSFYFHGRGTSLQKSPLGMYRTLLHQLYTYCPTIRAPVRSAFAEKASFGEQDVVWEWGVEELQEMVLECIKTVSEWRPVILFVDALDEAGVGMGPMVVEWLSRVLGWAGTEGREVRMVVSCRHYPVLSLIPGFEISVEDENAEEVRKFVSETLDKRILVWTRDERGCRALKKLEDAICDKAAGIFQWASLTVPMVIEKVNDGESSSEAHDMLEEVPRGLNGVYQHILANVIKAQHRSKALLMMQWVCLAETPLSLTELRYAMALDDVCNNAPRVRCEESKDFVELDGRMAVLIHSHSGGLVEVKVYSEDDASVIQFIHQSVADFFLEFGLAYLTTVTDSQTTAPSTTPTVVPSATIIAQSHDRLARSCLNYLTFSALVERVQQRNGGSPWNFLNRKVIPDFPLIRYASNYWFVHAERSERFGFGQETIFNYFDHHPGSFETWIAAYGCLGSRTARPELGWYCPAEGCTPLQVAAFASLQTTARHLLSEGAAVEEHVETAILWDARAVHFAASKGNTDMINLLASYSARLSPRTHIGYTPCHIAAMRGHRETVEYLMSQGVDIDEVTKTGTALMAACRGGQTTVVQMLLDLGADVNKETEFGNTALKVSAGNGSLDIAQLLLENGALLSHEGGPFGSAIQAAVYYDRLEMVRFLLKEGASPNADGAGGAEGSACQIAAKDGKVLMLELLIKRGADINASSEKYGNALHAAVASSKRNNEKMARYLLERGSDPNAHGGEHGNALQEASYWGRDSLVRLLLEHGAHTNAQGSHYGTPLQAAAHRNHPSVVSLLLAEGANVNMEGGEYGSILQAACEGASIELVRRLVKYGGDVNLRGGRYGCALTAAAACCRKDLVQYLLSVGADPNLTGGKYGSPLLGLMVQGHSISTSYIGDEEDKSMDIMETLLQHGTKLDHGHEIYGTPLHHAAYKGDIGAFNLLLQHGADICLQAGQHQDILQSAAWGGNGIIITTLLEKGRDVNQIGGEFGTALNAAAIARHVGAIKILLEHGAQDFEIYPGYRASNVANTEIKQIIHESCGAPCPEHAPTT